MKEYKKVIKRKLENYPRHKDEMQNLIQWWGFGQPIGYKRKVGSSRYDNR